MLIQKVLPVFRVRAISKRPLIPLCSFHVSTGSLQSTACFHEHRHTRNLCRFKLTFGGNGDLDAFATAFCPNRFAVFTVNHIALPIQRIAVPDRRHVVDAVLVRAPVPDIQCSSVQAHIPPVRVAFLHDFQSGLLSAFNVNGHFDIVMGIDGGGCHPEIKIHGLLARICDREEKSRPRRIVSCRIYSHVRPVQARLHLIGRNRQAACLFIPVPVAAVANVPPPIQLIFFVDFLPGNVRPIPFAGQLQFRYMQNQVLTTGNGERFRFKLSLCQPARWRGGGNTDHIACTRPVQRIPVNLVRIIFFITGLGKNRTGSFAERHDLLHMSGMIPAVEVQPFIIVAQSDRSGTGSVHRHGKIRIGSRLKIIRCTVYQQCDCLSVLARCHNRAAVHIRSIPALCRSFHTDVIDMPFAELIRSHGDLERLCIVLFLPVNDGITPGIALVDTVCLFQPQITDSLLGIPVIHLHIIDDRRPAAFDICKVGCRRHSKSEGISLRNRYRNAQCPAVHTALRLTVHLYMG